MPSYIQLIEAFAGSLLISLLITPVARQVSLKVGAVDYPSARRINREPLPHLGGPAMYLAFAAGIVLVLPGKASVGLLLGALLILVMGIIDDRYDLNPWAKLLTEVVAAAILIQSGFVVHFVQFPWGGYWFMSQWAVWAVTIVWIVGITNSINLIDGLDGLAAGVTTIVCIVMAYTAFVARDGWSLVIALALAGAIIGFWRYNRYPAKIIMGDSGALFLGFVIAAVSVHGLMKTTTMVAVAVPIVALGLPITDTVFAIARRLRQGKPIMQADRGHLHHRLLDEFGLPQTRAVLILHFVSACFGLAALALEAYQVWLALGVLAALALGARLSLSKAAPADNQRRQTGISDR